jgi:hypothetical protein
VKPSRGGARPGAGAKHTVSATGERFAGRHTAGSASALARLRVRWACSASEAIRRAVMAADRAIVPEEAT